MNKMNKILKSAGVWNSLDSFPHFSRSEINDYYAEIVHSPTKRVRVCMHSSHEEHLQEMLIGFSGKSYVRPSFHLKDESFHLLEGFGKYVFFNLQGEYVHDVRLGPYHSCFPFYCRIPGSQSHSLILYTKHAFAHEAVTGPFDRANTIFPSWSLDLLDESEQEKFRYEFSIAPVSPIEDCQFERVNERTFQVKSKIVAISKNDLHRLKVEAKPQVCLRVHPNDYSELQEVFTIYTDKVYVRPKKYVDHDKSFHVLEGNADCIIFDDQGNQKEVIPLGSNENFYVRVPKRVFHSICIRSKDFIVRETMSVSLRDQNIVWAPWSPSECDLGATLQFMSKLDSCILKV